MSRLQSHNVCRRDRGACCPERGWDPNSPAGATLKEAGRAGGRGGTPYSMMCRASTSETSSLSGSGIFFFSSTGRLGGCAGCGCSSSSSYRDTSPRDPRPPTGTGTGLPGGGHTSGGKCCFHGLLLCRNVSCLFSAASLNCSIYDF